MTQPATQNCDSILRFAEHNKINPDFFGTVTDTVFTTNYIEQTYKGHLKGQRFPQIRCFDKNKKIIMQWAICEGFLKKEKLFKTYPPKNPNNLDTLVTWKGTMDEIRNCYGERMTSEEIKKLEQADMVIVLYYVKYLGRLSESPAKIVGHYVRKHKKENIKVILVDVDVMNYWKTKVHINFNID